jgi:hypothetical protein
MLYLLLHLINLISELLLLITEAVQQINGVKGSVSVIGSMVTKSKISIQPVPKFAIGLISEAAYSSSYLQDLFR